MPATKNSRRYHAESRGLDEMTLEQQCEALDHACKHCGKDAGSHVVRGGYARCGENGEGKRYQRTAPVTW